MPSLESNEPNPLFPSNRMSADPVTFITTDPTVHTSKGAVELKKGQTVEDWLRERMRGSHSPPEILWSFEMLKGSKQHNGKTVTLEGYIPASRSGKIYPGGENYSREKIEAFPKKNVPESIRTFFKNHPGISHAVLPRVGAPMRFDPDRDRTIDLQALNDQTQ